MIFLSFSCYFMFKSSMQVEKYLKECNLSLKESDMISKDFKIKQHMDSGVNEVFIIPSVKP